MKKLRILFVIFCLITSSVCVFAGDFDYLEDLSPSQIEQLTQIQASYKKQINDIDNSLMNYNDKISQIKEDKNKTKEQASLLISAYERNIDSLTNQKKQLEAKTDEIYKSVLTLEQYNRYKSQQADVQNAFGNFLQK